MVNHNVVRTQHSDGRVRKTSDITKTMADGKSKMTRATQTITR